MPSIKRGIILLLVVVLFVLTSGCLNNILHPAGAEYPVIDHGDETPKYVAVEDTFTFQESDISIKYSIDKVLYEDAKNTDKYVYLYDNISDSEWVSEYYRSFVNSEYMDEVYDAILGSLRQVRDELSLDDDEYAELLSVYVQSIPYQTDRLNSDPRYPVETVYDDYGDCDDKSILLAGLLLKEGYDVALLEYESAEHMNVGIKSDGCEYGDTGYATIEATDVNLIGWERIEIGDGVLLDSEPIVITFDNTGDLYYTACSQVQKIYNIFENAAYRCDSLSSEIEKEEAELKVLKSEIDSLSTQLSQMRSRGDISAYNSNVAVYNSKVNSYNDRSDDLQRTVDRYNNCVEVHNWILNHQYDRPGLYEYALLQ